MRFRADRQGPPRRTLGPERRAYTTALARRRLCMAHRSRTLKWISAFAVVALLACSSGQEASPPAPPVDAGAAVGAAAAAEDTAAPTTESLPSDAQVDAPPPDVKDTEKVRCLVDSPDGCSGCDKGNTCVYE